MASRVSPRALRIASAMFVGGAMTALGCSLLVNFDESKIPPDNVVVDDTGG